MQPRSRTKFGVRGQLLTTHVQRVLENNLAVVERQRARATKLEAAGHRIVAGHPEGDGNWEVTDWRTGELIVAGNDETSTEDAMTELLDPDDRWFHQDGLYADEDSTLVATPGVPEAKAEKVEDWVLAPGTPVEELAEITGWPTEKVQQHLITL